jgi:hypothetical protein
MTPTFIEEFASLLHERMVLQRRGLAVSYHNSKQWQDRLYRQIQWLSTQETHLTREDSTSPLFLIHWLMQVWKRLKLATNAPPDERIAALDALFNEAEQQLLQLEKRGAGKRRLYATKYGTLVVGTRPVLANLPESNERPPLDSTRLYRRVHLVDSSVSIDLSREVVQGNQHKGAVYKFNTGQPVVGLAALSGRVRTQFEPTKRLSSSRTTPLVGFRSASMQPHDQYTAELTDCLDWAVREGVHILCMPELSICPKGRVVLQQYLQQLGPKLTTLCVIIAGSFHVGDYNEAVVWLVDGLGQVTEWAYQKHQAYGTRLKEQTKLPALWAFAEQQQIIQDGFFDVQEDIIGGQHMLLLDLPIGLVGVVICKDFLTPNTCLKYDEVEPDYLFIVSMNEQGGEFYQTWQKGAKRFHLSGGFYVNATQVVAQHNSETEVLFWGLPFQDSKIYFRHLPDNPHGGQAVIPPSGLLSVKLPSSPFNRSSSAFNLL